MKKIFLSILILGVYSISYGQREESNVLKFRSEMRMVQNVNDRVHERRYDEISLLLFDFDKKTINVHPDQFKLNMLKPMEELTTIEGFSSLNILCLDERQKKCNVTVYFKGQNAVIIDILFDDFDYAYSIK